MDQGATEGPGTWLAIGNEVIRALRGVAAGDLAGLEDTFGDTERRWFFGGQGRSGLVARTTAMRMMHIGRRVHVVGEATAPSIRADDGLLIISGSGVTPISTLQARVASGEGAQVAVITRNPDSELAAIADVTVLIPISHTRQLGGNLFEQASLLILDGLVQRISGNFAGAQARLRYLHSNMQ
jgi:6-phospho-3-hexuloisomerase